LYKSPDREPFHAAPGPTRSEPRFRLEARLPSFAAGLARQLRVMVWRRRPNANRQRAFMSSRELFIAEEGRKNEKGPRFRLEARPFIWP